MLIEVVQDVAQLIFMHFSINAARQLICTCKHFLPVMSAIQVMRPTYKCKDGAYPFFAERQEYARKVLNDVAPLELVIRLCEPDLVPAARSGDAIAVRALLAGGKYVDSHTNQHVWDALMSSALNGHYPVRIRMSLLHLMNVGFTLSIHIITIRSPGH